MALFTLGLVVALMDRKFPITEPFMSALCVTPSETSNEVATLLFEAAEEYARRRGAK